MSHARSTHLKTRSEEAPVFGRRGLGDVDVGDDADCAGGEPRPEAADEHHPDVDGGNHHEVEEREERRDEEHGEAPPQPGAHVARQGTCNMIDCHVSDHISICMKAEHTI